MKNFTAFLVLVLSFSAYGQTAEAKKIDSLEQLLHKLNNLEKERKHFNITNEKIEVLCQLSKQYDGVDSTKTFDYGFEALHLSKRKGYRQGEAHANFMLGRALMYLDYNRSKDFLLKGKAIADSLMNINPSKELKAIWASGTYNLALINGYLGQHDKELAITDIILPTIRELGDSLFLGNIYTNLGVKNLNLADYEAAFENLNQGRKIYKDIGDPKEVTFTLTQLAMVFEALDSLDRMKMVLDEARLNLKKYPNTFDEFNYHIQNSQYHLKTKAYDLAILDLGRARKLIGGDKTSIQYGMVEQRTARVYEARKDYKYALAHITKYIENSEIRNNIISIYQGYYKKAQYAAGIQDYKGAYGDLRKALDLYDSIETNQLKSDLRELEIKYEIAEKEKNLFRLKNERNEANLSLEKQRSRTYLYATIIGSMVLVLLIGYRFYQNKLRKAKRKERIREAEVQLLKQEQQNKVFSAMIEGQEKERKRLAIDLHDGLGGRLSGISLNLSKLDKDQPKEYPEKQLQKVMKDLNSSLQELRTIARNLMPETLVKFGLEAALKDYCSSMTGNKTKVTLQFYGPENDIDLNQQVTIYRVIQELINNAVKHSEATEILVQYIREGNTVDITVEDNGIGFIKEDQPSNNKGMGLSNLRTRVAYLKGELDVQSEANEGTTVNIHINIDAA